MGFKRFVEYFKIDLKKHIVQVCEQKIMVGSCYISDLLVVDMRTGALTVKDGWERQTDCYRDLIEAPASRILSVVEEPDQFCNSIPVFISNNGMVEEDFCEVFGYPNVTHTGRLMYENTSFLTKEKALAHAIESMTFRMEHQNRRREELLRNIDEIDRDLAESSSKRDMQRAKLAELQGQVAPQQK